VEAEGLVLDDTLVELEARSLKAFAASGVAAVKDGHIVFFSHLIDSIKEAEEVLLGINIFLAMGTQKNVFAFLKSQTLVDVAGFNLG
jgi:hypothetical protein